MKKLLIILLFLPMIGFGQDNNNCSPKRAYNIETAKTNCFEKIKYSNGIHTKYRNVDIAIEKIVSSVSIPNSFKLVECEDINNCFATIISGERYIIYDKEFLDKISEKTNNWGEIFSLAHEIGHHINGDLISEVNYRQAKEVTKEKTNAESRKMELEADKFAGSVIARLGGSIEDATMSIRLLTNPSLNSTHPQTKDRVNSIILGYNNAKKSNLNATIVNVNNTNTVYLDRNSKDYQDIFLYLLNHGKVNNKFFTGVTVLESDKVTSSSKYYDYISLFEKDATSITKSFYKNGINYMARTEISTGEFIEYIYDRKTINDNGQAVKVKITAWHNNGIKAASVTELGFGRKGGEDKRWSKQGNLLRDENYNNGKRDGWQRRWTEVEGEQFYYTYRTREEFYENDEKIKGFINVGYKNVGGEVRVKDNYKCIDEVIIERYENGNPKSKYIYLNSFRQKYILYLENGKKRMSQQWIENVFCYDEENKFSPCVVKIFNEDSQFLQLQWNFENPIKIIKRFYKNGELKWLREEEVVSGDTNREPVKSKKCWNEKGIKIECE